MHKFQEDMYVDLAVVKSIEVEKDWKQSERSYHLALKHEKKEIIEIKDIVTADDRLVSLRGVAGIGKTCLLESIAHRWANDKLYTGENNSLQVDILFILTCRELNLLSKNATLRDIIESADAKVSDCMIEDITDISDRVMIVLDGTDEWNCLSEIQQIKTKKCSPITTVVHDLINPTSKIFPGSTILIAGRPQACDIIESILSCSRIKRIESIGFSNKIVKLYVQNYFKDDENLCDFVLQTIEEVTTLKNMSSIPVYLWIICHLYSYDDSIPAPKTSTRLLLYTLLIFLSEHLKTSQTETKTWYEIASDENILKSITQLASLSNEMYTHGKVVFYENDFTRKDLLALDLEISGFIVCSKTKMFGRIYQFRHLVLMEFFTAIDIFLHLNSYTPDEIENNYAACMPIISGLQGILKVANQSKQTDAADVFMSNISNGIPDECNLNLISHFCKSLSSSKEIRSGRIYYQQWLLFLTCLFESGIKIYDVSKENFNVSRIDVQLLHHELIYLLNFLDQLEYKYMENLKVVMKDRLLSMEEFERLCTHLLRSETVDLSMNLLPTKGLSYLSSEYVQFKSSKINLNLSACNLKDAGASPISTVINNTEATSQELRLDKLNISSCKLTDNAIVELSPCIIYLTELNLSDNKNISAVGIKALSTVINNTKATSQEFRLDKLDISSCDLTDNDITELSPCIIYLTELNLSYNKNISAVGIKAISTVINNTKATSQEFRLDKLSISACNLSDNAIVELSPCIIYLTELNLGGNKKISAVGIKAISTVINDTKVTSQEFRLDKLNISACNLTDNDIVELSPCIIYLTELDLGLNKSISAVGIKAISTVINNTKATSQEFRLDKLNISSCNLTDNAIVELSPCIIYLTELNLGANKNISAVGIKAISTVINNTKATSQEFRLDKLNISSCNLTDNAIVELSPCIIYLTELNLGANKNISAVGIKAISTVINNTKATSQEFRLDKLHIYSCDLTDNDITELSPCIVYLTELNLSYNKNISAIGIKAISTVINNTKATSQEFRLDKLDLSFCKLTDNAITELSPCRTYLTELKLESKQRR